VYGRATGFETMVGWLFLNNPVRLAELLDQLEMAGSNSITPPPTP
jgi:ribonuclease-3 family protein